MQIFVLGMHRSGTSAVTRVLGLLGVHLGNPSEMNPTDDGNPRGYWERREVLALDEEILAALEASWCEPLPADPARLHARDRASFEKRAASIVSSLDPHRPWALKDPRFCLLLPLWRAVLTSPLCVLVHRDPLEVARSLRTRNGFPLPLGLALWESHARAALSSSEGLPRLLVSYPSLVDDPVGTAGNLVRRLADLGVVPPGSVPERALLEFVSPSLRRERSVPSERREFLTTAQAELLRSFEGPELSGTPAPEPLSGGARELLESFSDQLKGERTRTATLRADVAARAEDVRRFTALLAERDGVVASLRSRIGFPGEERPSAVERAPATFPDPPNLTLCTIVARNYLAAARALCRSFLRHHPGARVFVLLADEIWEDFDPSQEPFDLVEARDLGVPDFRDLAFRYTVLELATALKPAFLLHLLEKKGVDRLVYLDSDTYVYGPLEEVRQSLEAHDVVLTPHILEPLRPDGRMPEERDLLAAGVFNLGFVAVRRSPAALALLDWWAARLHEGAYVDFVRGLFTDQKWMNLAPCFLDRLEVLRHRGYNVAYWNFQERFDLARSGDAWTVGADPLRFVHFSGLNPDQPNLVSKHQNRFRLTDLGRTYRELFESYLSALEADGLEKTRRLLPRYSVFEDGTPVPAVARRLFRDLGEGRRRFGNPFRSESGSFLEWLRAPRVPGSPVTHLVDFLYQQRPDVMRAFPGPDDVDALALHDWLVAHAGDDFGLDEAWIETFRQTCERVAARNAELAAAEQVALEQAAKAKAEAERESEQLAVIEEAAREKAETGRETARLVAATAAAVAEEVRRERVEAEQEDEPKAPWKWWGRLLLGPDRYRLLRSRFWRFGPKR